MEPLPAFGRRLRWLRRAAGFKQSHVADLAGVTQATVSRWEAGDITPVSELAARVLKAFRSTTDAALARLVRSSTLAVHLVSDGDHRLLAASPLRKWEWGPRADDFAGKSLWRFAPPSIVEAEHRLLDAGWWDTAYPAPVRVLVTRSPGEIDIAGGPMLWERVWLADGTVARLCTSGL